ncbi:MAG: four helix bundle protein [Gemmatimonadetes bacterium]|nr:four helix bundle protein [Gemmatimonadota bacterium]
MVVRVYTRTKSLPPEERFVAVPQMRRAAWSVPTNIAEGNAKRGRGELRRYLDCALGSLGEVDTWLAGLGDLYKLDGESVVEIEDLRRRITAGIFAVLRRGRQ